MKLKHRKLILIISLSAMGVGLITFSVAGNKEKQSTEVASVTNEGLVTETPTPTDEATPTPAEADKEVTATPTEEPTAEVTEEPTGEPTPEATVEPTEEPTGEPVKEENLELKEENDAKINDLITDYLQAKLDGKTKKLKKLVTDPSYIDAETIQKKTEFIDSYDKIKVYTLPGKGDIDYIAYVYMEVKITTIETKAPGLDVFYIKKVDDEYKIVCGDVSDETYDYIKKCNKSDEVKALSDKVGKKLDKAIAKDEELADFCNKIDVSSKQSKKKKK